jgi:hypothetical protein
MDLTPPSATKSETTTSSLGTFAKLYSIIASIFGIAWVIAFHFGAAYLSHAKYNSFGWALVDFFFAAFYYPYYALVLNSPSSGLFGGRRK